MSKTKIAMAATLAMLALGAVAVSSASASSWFINGTALTSGSAALSSTAKIDTFTNLTIPQLPLKIQCTGTTLRYEGHEIKGPSEAAASSLELTGCGVVQPNACTLSSTTVKTNPIIIIVIIMPAPVVLLRAKPRAGKIFTEITFNGASCAISGLQPATGEVTLNLPTGQSEEQEQAIEGLGSAENPSLTIDKDPAFIEGGKALNLLASGQKWSFH